ncbi:DUF4124 domain-containing protein [Lysobacter sp. cf310]|uniref:DUF4124 domain-containing protein n=1 Tax=Lysobacter sp. cf310 TaxID=1761790 RepID=UPI0008EE0B2E|nr:DUF4124 domain-containing protein [Lysobacter sp. cf310]SFK93177.1 protein of unknown function [Lysobacter sp. cf310]
MRIGLALLLFAVIGLASAEAVYKCVGKGGAVNYQSHPCPATHQVAKSWDATPEPPPSDAELWRRYHQRKKADADSRYFSQLAGTARRGGSASVVYKNTPHQRSACEVARETRESFLLNSNTDVSHDVRRRLNDAVFDACE